MVFKISMDKYTLSKESLNRLLYQGKKEQKINNIWNLKQTIKQYSKNKKTA